MSLKNLLDTANDAYPDHDLEWYYDDHGRKAEPSQYNEDGLARFIVREIQDVYDRNATDQVNQAEAVRAIQTGIEQLQAVLNALMKGTVKGEYENGVCPDCAEPISVYAEPGNECPNCGHVFWLAQPTDDGT